MTRFRAQALLAATVLLLSVTAVTVGAATTGAWLRDRTLATQPSLMRAVWTDESSFGVQHSDQEVTLSSSALKPMFLSLLMPGLGEVSMGYKRGWALMALDVASWIGVKHYHDEGTNARQDYYDFLDAHWSEQRLARSFDPDAYDSPPGTFFYGNTMEDPNDYTTLSLWVSREDDPREYYENAGKWDQFVFGWDDFSDPRDWSADWVHDTFPDYDRVLDIPVNKRTRILRDTRVSANREIYRSMRSEANDLFAKRDRLVVLNLVTRLASMIQVAVLHHRQGRSLNMAGHQLSVIAQPSGLTTSRLGLALSY